MTIDSNVKEWYLNEFPTDTLGEEIDEEITFRTVYEQMVNIDVYAIIDTCDSIIRERIFDKVAELYNISYDELYERWLSSEN